MIAGKQEDSPLTEHPLAEPERERGERKGIMFCHRSLGERGRDVLISHRYGIESRSVTNHVDIISQHIITS